MPKTITLRLSDDAYEKFNRAAIADKRSIANLIETLALRKLDEESLADDFEMQEIFSNAPLLKKLEKGHSDATLKKVRMVG
jgi:predicted CopG family antitoxin